MDYTIAKGDTLSKIAQINNTDVNTLSTLNKINNPNMINAGQVIKLPGQTGQNGNINATPTTDFSKLTGTTGTANTFVTPPVVPVSMAGPVTYAQQAQESVNNQEFNPYDAQRNQLLTDLKGQMDLSTNKSADTAQYNQDLNVNSNRKATQDIINQINALHAGNEVNKLNIGQNAGGLTVASASNESDRLDRQNAIKAITLGAQLQATQGNLALATDMVSQAINAKYDPIEKKIEALKTYYDINKDLLSSYDSKAFKKQQILLEAKAKDLEVQKANEQQINNLSMSIAKNGAPSSVVQAITKAKSFNDAIVKASPYLQSLSDKADISYKIAQTANLYSEIKARASTHGSNLDPSQSLAYAQEYASTGKIPTGIPKGGFGTVSQWAKELPKQNGEIISTATGVHPAQDSTYADALSSLSSVVKLAQDLKTQDKNRIGGLIGGTLGLITGSKAQGDYISTRTQIVDLLSRARSGAALTENEVKTYENMIPSRFSEPFALGQNSDVAIQQFVNSITKDMQNKANAKGWSIYGVSKVKLGESEYTVGDIIHSGDKAGRINADGTITLIQ